MHTLLQSNSANDIIMFRYSANTVFYVEDNIIPMIESLDYVMFNIMFDVLLYYVFVSIK